MLDLDSATSVHVPTPIVVTTVNINFCQFVPSFSSERGGTLLTHSWAPAETSIAISCIRSIQLVCIAHCKETKTVVSNPSPGMKDIHPYPSLDQIHCRYDPTA